MVNYENLDNHQTGIHDYFKFLKFGLEEQLILLVFILGGKLNRQEGLNTVKKLDGLFPWTYLGKSLQEILKPLDISVEEFIEICDQFTNKKIFKTDSTGNLIKDNKGNLTKTNYDNL